MDKIFESWLERQCADALALMETSDVVTILPAAGPQAARRFIAQFANPTMVRTDDRIVRADGFTVLIQFPPDYLRAAFDAAQVVNVLAPGNLFHPNVRPPFICTGRLSPGTGICDLLYQLDEILTFARFTPREDDALNHEACQWARQHMHLFPLEARPLRRRTPDWLIGEVARAEVRA